MIHVLIKDVKLIEKDLLSITVLVNNYVRLISYSDFYFAFYDNHFYVTLIFLIFRFGSKPSMHFNRVCI